MLLDSIEVSHFRNLSGKISCGSRLNIIVGHNGQGKTNWLEAIYLPAWSKSFRTTRLQEAIAFGSEVGLSEEKSRAGTRLKGSCTRRYYER